MVSLKWGDVLSTLLPGALALYALAPYLPFLNARLVKLDEISTAMGVVLLMAACLAGGILEAFTRIAWEKLWLMPNCKPPDSLGRLKMENLELYERGVQSSYKYVTFYANFAWAVLLLMFTRPPCTSNTLLLGLTVLILLRASHVQWTYFVNYMTKVFGPMRSDDADQRSAGGNESKDPVSS